MAITAIVDTQTNEFVPSGHDQDARHVKQPLPRNPNPDVERWSGDPNNPFTSKTAGEIAAAAAAALDADATAGIDQKDLKAAIMALWEAIPSPLMTKAQLRARAIAIRKTL